MNAKQNLNLPADCTLLTEDEMLSATGGTAVETIAKAVVAVGVSAALLVVGGIAARGILSIFGGVSSVSAGSNFIDIALASGQNFLDNLMGL